MSLQSWLFERKPLVESIPFTSAVLCMDCEVIARLDKHGRCSVCGSDSVLVLRNTLVGKD